MPAFLSPRQKSASFTLVEVIIAITLFSVLSVSAMVVWQDILKSYKRIQMEEYLSTETSALLERMARTVQDNGLDYEEYYSIRVLSATNVGENYGEYHKQFFHPGYPGVITGTAGPEPDEYEYGAWCLDGNAYTNNGCAAGVLPDTATFDFDTGQHPYEGSGMNADEGNALCEGSTTCTKTLDYHEVAGLFLINATGTERTYFVKENGKVPAVAMVKLSGTDSDSDGLIDTWECDDRFNCTGTGETGNLLPPLTDLSDGLVDNDDFFPISPKHLFIDELIFYISPIEDPFKGYNEDGSAVFENVQIHPHVTIRIQAHFQLYDDADNPVDFEDYAGLVGLAPTITLETTVSTGNTEEIPAYSFP